MTDAQPWAGRRLHVVGMGGAGMSGLARVALQLGAQVSGSDRADSPVLAELARLGAQAFVGHAAAQVPPGAEVVYSTAVGADNPERGAGAAELHRSELLAELTRMKPAIAVAGTHGKTTTASMLVHALAAAGEDPAYLVGGDVRSTGVNAAWGSGRWLVVEADESDRSLLALDVEIALLTNAELDHHSTYASRRDVDAVFAAFLSGARRRVVWERPELLALAPDAIPYAPRALELRAGGSAFEAAGVRVELTVPGEHNATNAAGALTACAVAGVDVAVAAAALRTFTGAGRRFERLGAHGGAEVVDDYAHHPTEVAATLAAARTLAPRRLVAVFQPHLFSRTRAAWREFGRALAAADVVVVLDVYPARERAEDFPGVSGRLVAQAAADAAGGRPVYWMPERARALELLRALARPGDLLLTLGAGDVVELARALVAERT